MEVSGSGDGRTVETRHHPSNAISGRTRWVEGNPPVREAFAYRSDGLLSQMMRQGGQGNSKDLSYSYDLNGNRTSDERAPRLPGRSRGDAGADLHNLTAKV